MYQAMAMKERLAIVSISFINALLKKFFSISLSMGIIVFVYEQFSNGITSNSMRLSILVPLVFGIVIESMRFFKNDKLITITLLTMSMVTLMTGMFLYGVFEIYGNQSIFVPYLYYVGYGMLVLSLIVFFMERKTRI